MSVSQSVRFRFAFGLVVVWLASTSGGRAVWSQEPGKAKDEALDSLIEKLSESPEKPAVRSDQPAGSAGAKAEARPAKPAAGKPAQNPPTGDGAGSAATEKGGKAADKSRAPDGGLSSGSGGVSTKDQELDSLLEKLGETKDTPTPEDRPRSGGPGEKPKEPSPAQKPDPAKLGGKDKDLDDRLEEISGKKKKRPSSDEQRSGPVGEIIKEMRDVEQRLGKPDPSEETRAKQKQIVKHIDTLIEQVRRSESTMGRLMRRQRSKPGQQPGDQPGDQQGAMARGAPPMKPAKPTGQHSTAGGKDIWGHLPAELRQVMENSFKEQSLSAKAELISRYFLSVAKGKPQRED